MSFPRFNHKSRDFAFDIEIGTHFVSKFNLNVAEISGRSRYEVGRDGRHCWYC